ncbi:MAG: hypothetical protein ABI977_32190 [Acidobacteriota bacterium]
MLAFISLFFLFCSPVAESQGGAKIDAAKLPRMAAAVREFVPSGWMIEAQVEGDLNKDSVPDLAITMVEQMPANADKDNLPERQRALLILFKTTDGKLSRAALADKVLLCTRCGGAFYGVVETPANVQIAGGVIIVRQEYGSREVTQETLRFRYDPEAGRFAFIGADVKSNDRATGETVTESTNLLTGVKLTARAKINEKTGKQTPAASKSQRVSRSRKFIEDVVAGETALEEK